MRTISILAIIAFAAGCASLPPTIDQGEYQNYQYGFIVQLPRDGWERVKSVPAGFAPYLLAEAPARLLLMLHNPRTGGLIAVQGGTMPLHYERLSKSDIDARVMKVAKIMHLDQVLDRLPHHISEGEKQRLAVALWPC